MRRRRILVGPDPLPSVIVGRPAKPPSGDGSMALDTDLPTDSFSQSDFSLTDGSSSEDEGNIRPAPPTASSSMGPARHSFVEVFPKSSLFSGSYLKLFP